MPQVSSCIAVHFNPSWSIVAIFTWGHSTQEEAKWPPQLTEVPEVSLTDGVQSCKMSILLHEAKFINHNIVIHIQCLHCYACNDLGVLRKHIDDILEKSPTNVTSAVMHALILVHWGDTRTTHYCIGWYFRTKTKFTGPLSRTQFCFWLHNRR